MSDSQDNNFFSINIKNDSVITNSPAVLANFGGCQLFCIKKRSLLKLLEGLLETFLDDRIELLNVFYRTLRVEQFIRHLYFTEDFGMGKNPSLFVVFPCLFNTFYMGRACQSK